MTDTPRTLTQLQALFADNTTENISAQDLRDFVVSAALPRPSFKYLQLYNNATQISGILDGYGDMVEVSELPTSGGGFVAVADLSAPVGSTLALFDDPEGWLVDEEWIDTGQFYFYDNGPGATDLYPANTTLLLPAGRYTAAFFAVWGSQSALASGSITVYLDFAENVGDLESQGMLYTSPTMQTTSATLINNVWYGGQSLELSQARHVQVIVYAYQLPSVRKLTALKVWLMKES